MVANIVALGVLTQLIPELEKQSVLDAILQEFLKELRVLIQLHLKKGFS